MIGVRIEFITLQYSYLWPTMLKIHPVTGLRIKRSKSHLFLLDIVNLLPILFPFFLNFKEIIYIVE